MKAAVKPPDLQPTGVQVEVAQFIDPLYTQGAHGPDSIAADTNQLADTTEKVEFIKIISNEAATESRTAAAIAVKNRAVEYMTVNNKVELKGFVEELKT